jgi:TPR repeat protein
MNSPKQLLNAVKPVLWLVVAAATLFLLFIGYWILDKLLAYRFASSYVSKIAEVFDTNRHLAEAITLIVALAVALCTGLIFSLSKRRRLIGLGGLFALLVLNSLVLWHGTSGQYVDRSGQALKCYFFVGEQLMFGERPGFDPVTGRQCRPVTPEILARLNNYQSGQKPKEMVQSDVIFFDPRSGEPRIWYVRTKEGRLRLFDLPGFDPESGLELSPATRDVAADWPKQHASDKAAATRDRAPNRVDPTKVQFFDPRSGTPTVWYWRSANGDFEFFDNEGFHPLTGDKLLPVSKDVVEEYAKRRAQIEQEIEAKRVAEQSRIAEEEARRAAAAAIEAEGLARIERDRQAAAAAARAEAARLAQVEAERQAQIERDRRAEQAKKEAEEQQLRQAADDCDRLAANPNDRRKPAAVSGVSFAYVQAVAVQAAQACEKARRVFPDEPRYKYQMARAYQAFEPKKALAYYRELTTQSNYPAAYDNLGSLYLDGRAGETNYSIAARAFRSGAELGDPDAMVSLAKMYVQGLGVLKSDEEANRWYERAASFGHPDAVQFVEKTQANKRAQQQTQQFMMDTVGEFLKLIPRQ